MKKNPNLIKLSVFGNPIVHSLSPKIHQAFAQQFGLEITYTKELASLDGFNHHLNRFISNGGMGCNITVPFKQAAYQICAQLTTNAKLAGAVNTIKVLEDNTLLGENTDGNGLIADLTHRLKINLNNKVILILGAGGASQGILYPLLQQKPKRIMIANRTASKAKDLAKKFSSYGQTCGFGLDKVKNEPVDIIINATSASLDNVMPTIANGVASNAICYDLMYGKNTAFMQWAINNKALKVIDGSGMLIEQAALSFEFWLGKKPNTNQVMTLLRNL